MECLLQCTNKKTTVALISLTWLPIRIRFIVLLVSIYCKVSWL